MGLGVGVRVRFRVRVMVRGAATGELLEALQVRVRVRG